MRYPQRQTVAKATAPSPTARTMMQPCKKARKCSHWAAGISSATVAETIIASVGVEWPGSCLQFDLLVDFINEWRDLMKLNPDRIDAATVKLMWHWSPERNHASIIDNGLIAGGTRGIPVKNGAVHGTGVYGSPNINAAKRYGEGTTNAFGCVVLLGCDSVETHWGSNPIWCVAPGRGPRVLLVGRTSGDSEQEIAEVESRMQALCAVLQPSLEDADYTLENAMTAHVC